jgi:hypothetical protein
MAAEAATQASRRFCETGNPCADKFELDFTSFADLMFAWVAASAAMTDERVERQSPANVE